jgi:hypothetical protein
MATIRVIREDDDNNNRNAIPSKNSTDSLVYKFNWRGPKNDEQDPVADLPEFPPGDIFRARQGRDNIIR